jgi:ABC-type sugar transport system permease subunit
MVGLLLLPLLLHRIKPLKGSASESLHITLPWVTAGAVAAVIFIGVFGPGLSLA